MQKLYAREKNIAGQSFVEPKIITHIRDNVLTELAFALKDSNIVPYGALNQIFSLANISEWKIDKMAAFIHAGYYCNSNKSEKDEDSLTLFEKGIRDYEHQSEVNKRSSRATAIHIKYKFSDLGIQFEMGTEKLYENEEKIRENEENLLIAEHNRWNTFQMLDGWEIWDEESFIPDCHRDKKAKMHAYLAKFEELDDIAEKIYNKDIRPTDSDRMVLRVMTDAFAYGVYEEYDRDRISAMINRIINVNSAEKTKAEVR